MPVITDSFFFPTTDVTDIYKNIYILYREYVYICIINQSIQIAKSIRFVHHAITTTTTTTHTCSRITIIAFEITQFI